MPTRPVALRLGCLLTTVALIAGVPALSHAAPTGRATTGVWKARPATYGVVVEKDVPVVMTDGVVLRVDVRRPAVEGVAAKGRFPVVLSQTPYNKASGALAFEADHLVTRGYVQVTADVRGTGGSGGTWDSFGAREQRDGFELAEWASSTARPWSNGRLGLHGSSYGAINQIFTAAQHPSGLKAIFPVVPMGDSYRDITGSGGQVNTSFIPLWLGLVSSLGLAPPTYTPSDPAAAAAAVGSHVGGAASFQVATVGQAMTGGTPAYDGPFHQQRSPLRVVDRVQVPTFVVGGWYDLFQRGEPMLFSRLHGRGVPSRLLMGPWTHLTAADAPGLAASGLPSLADLEVRWMDRYVRGDRDDAMDRDIAPVTYKEEGQGTWTRASAWPPADVTYRALNLGGTATPGRSGTLSASRPSDTAADVLPWSPATGVCSRGTVQWTAGAGAGTPCETDQRANDAYGLSYDLPVKQDLRVAGPVSGRLFVSTNGRNAQLTVRVEDVAPDGTSTQLSAGWQVLSLRALDRSRSLVRNGLIAQPWHPYTKESERPVAGSEVMEVYVEVFPVGAKFAKGHTLRMTIQPADAPHLTPSAPQAVSLAGGVISIWHDAKHPSQLIVPIRA
jgi:putative CocE/NonD family hydrolase